ncbi:hypothetical protein F5879DRAFT_330223 [Lentinula edodes]|nr:hypothetical protein F5879DRAFT_330223 [Lentinula edodes]
MFFSPVIVSPCMDLSSHCSSSHILSSSVPTRVYNYIFFSSFTPFRIRRLHPHPTRSSDLPILYLLPQVTLTTVSFFSLCTSLYHSRNLHTPLHYHYTPHLSSALPLPPFLTPNSPRLYRIEQDYYSRSFLFCFSLPILYITPFFIYLK